MSDLVGPVLRPTLVERDKLKDADEGPVQILDIVTEAPTHRVPGGATGLRGQQSQLVGVRERLPRG